MTPTLPFAKKSSAVEAVLVPAPAPATSTAPTVGRTPRTPEPTTKPPPEHANVASSASNLGDIFVKITVTPNVFCRRSAAAPFAQATRRRVQNSKKYSLGAVADGGAWRYFSAVAPHNMQTALPGCGLTPAASAASGGGRDLWIISYPNCWRVVGVRAVRVVRLRTVVPSCTVGEGSWPAAILFQAVVVTSRVVSGVQGFL